MYIIGKFPDSGCFHNWTTMTRIPEFYFVTLYAIMKIFLSHGRKPGQGRIN